ncbi:MAG: hypothetical protein ACREXP_19380 [Steroidobacteraceae bacterium]
MYASRLNPATAARQILEAAAREARYIVFCGIPGAGKSFLLREQLGLAVAAGRSVSLLQWDVMRQAFEQPAVLSRYPEIGGSTHAMIRRAVGLWVRGAIARWATEHSRPTHVLLIEAPLVGGRMIELARHVHDAAEPLLSGPDARYFVPSPSVEVRAAIEAARREEMSSHRHARDAANAPPQLVDELWQLVAMTAARLGLASGVDTSAYSPDLYFAVYQAVLHRRAVTRVPVEEIIHSASSPYEFGAQFPELAPSAVEVNELIARAESEGLAQVTAAAECWYES